ncbi:MAG TPA: hypothetical protein VG756_26235 [Pseudonocardiaceae bacterium]|jgi:hypothetical protein|nr:hypothetical protein [Pseudonocardiaceae bacterium]
MRGTGVRGIGTVGVLLAAGVLLGASSATAATNPAGVASLGSASVVQDGVASTVAPVGQCDLAGQPFGDTSGASLPGVVSYGTGHSSCTVQATANTSTSTATGASFTLTALRSYGGPVISLGSYTVTCTAKVNATNANWEYANLIGITGLPSPLPTDYTREITGADGTVLAKVVLNEVVLPSPNDGSIELNLMHIQLFPDGGPLSGDIYVGSTACSPTTAPSS